MESLLSQIYTFLVMFIFGFMLAVIFNLYLKIIEKLQLSKIITNILDLCFGILAGSIGFLILIFTNWGLLRFYVFLAIILGFLLYFYSLKLIKER